MHDLKLSLDLLGNLCVTTPAGTTLKLDPDLCHYQLTEMLSRSRPGDTGLGSWNSPTQWDLDEPIRKAKIWAQFQGRPPTAYFANNPAVLPPAVRKFSRTGKELLPDITLEDLGL